MYRRWLWPSFASPGVLWLVLLFIVPFYAVLGVAFGTVDRVLFQPVPIWDPLNWNVGWIGEVLGRLAPGGIWFDVGIRTIVYVLVSLALCLLIGYPVAYFTARHAGRWKGVVLILIILPLDELHDADARLGEFPPDGRLRQRLPNGHPRPEPATGLARRERVHGHPRPRLRLHPVSDPAALRLPRPHRPQPPRSGT